MHLYLYVEITRLRIGADKGVILLLYLWIAGFDSGGVSF